MRKLTVLLWLGMITAAISGIFWYNEWKFKLPTPVPTGYHPVSQGEIVSLPAAFYAGSTKPVFLHFFNPDCPCSKFNMRHFKSLVSEFGQTVNFRIVVVSNDRYNERDVQQKFAVNLPVSFDTSLARICGVYSTPQAVLVTASHQLYYRGNYNRSRYCTDSKTNYAEIALNGLTHHLPTPGFDQFALTSYGCELPQNKNQYP